MRRIYIIQKLGCGPVLVRLIEDWQAKAQESTPEVAATYHHCTDSLLTAICGWLTRELSVKEAAEISGKSQRHIRRLIHDGQLTRLGGNGERLRVILGELLCVRLR